ncbi:eukaryotic translation initiation factor subunit eIF2B-gamma [Penicillium angulare]|uniref:eukaryotic translation initiation factor subunit eIF2B-gamma n=1 Tax=Penicillium angulare TaxID=116970 RepID=UPI002540ACF0|nr:eukaryotic translation initiation factor subunit eIF2B-gamma [Penicillium angulare]KAJ5286591.1 eukaryotic translation initiation factor subunit eIF2B-gamma [Penicillium angulare]
MAPSIPVPQSGFQAIILCGPGVSLNTFTANPEEYPKCLIPVGNRVMLYYPMTYALRAGITDITLITPPTSLAPIQAALQQNPHLTALPSPRVIAPKGLEMTMGTAELLRLPEIQACIKTDFLLLPCDLISEIPGESLIEAWMVSQGALGGSTLSEGKNAHGPVSSAPGGEQGGRRGGLSVFYQTQGREESVKGESTDFVAVAPLEQDKDEAPAVSHLVDGPQSVRSNLSKLVLSMPMDTLKEKMEKDKGFLLRHSLIEQHPNVKMLTSYRDAHLYVFPYWVKELARQEKLESVSEDILGYWAKAGWQKGLADKLGMKEIFQKESHGQHETGSQDGESLEDEIDLRGMSTTKIGSNVEKPQSPPVYASRVKASNESSKTIEVPPILAYVQRGSAPFVRRVDSTAILLSTSLRLAKLESTEEAGRQASPFAHNQKIAHPDGVAQRSTVTKTDCLLAENVTVEEKCVIKESVIGANCHISTGARLTRCLLMDGATVGPRAVLSGCVIGKRAKIGREAQLKDCEVQDGNVVEDEADAKNEKFMVFEGIDDGEAGGDFDDEF